MPFFTLCLSAKFSISTKFTCPNNRYVSNVRHLAHIKKSEERQEAPSLRLSDEFVGLFGEESAQEERRCDGKSKEKETKSKSTEEPDLRLSITVIARTRSGSLHKLLLQFLQQPYVAHRLLRFHLLGFMCAAESMNVHMYAVTGVQMYLRAPISARVPSIEIIPRRDLFPPLVSRIGSPSVRRRGASAVLPAKAFLARFYEHAETTFYVLHAVVAQILGPAIFIETEMESSPLVSGQLTLPHIPYVFIRTRRRKPWWRQL